MTEKQKNILKWEMKNSSANSSGNYSGEFE